MAMASTVGVEALALVLLLFVQVAAAETDGDALLAFKAGVSDDPSGALRSWNGSVHFCRWAGVNCTAGRVTALDVSSRRLAGAVSPAVGNLTYLEVFNLTSNGFSGAVPESLGRLRRLRYLNLYDNAFSGEIPAALRGCGSLAVAFLNNNRLTGGIPDWLGALSNLTVLRLSYNSLTGRIPPSLANLTKLQRLELESNLLEGTIPDGLARLPDLRFFNVYQNSLAGAIPPGFFNMSSLQRFSVANNAFRGELPPDVGARSPNLQYLLLGGNHLAGPIPASLSNASQLQFLSLANNSFTGKVPPEIGKLCLLCLHLSNNELTATDAGGWEFMDNLTSCNILAEILLDGNNLAGTMPSSVTALSAVQLRKLNLAGNRISGMISPAIGNLVGLQTLDLRYNLLSGVIPEAIGKLKNLQNLRLQGNELTSSLPSAIGDLTKLLSLDLSNNLFNGSIPSSIGNLQQLTLLNLSGNELAGHVPRELFGLSSLSLLMDLSDNQLDGLLPRDIGQLGKLAHLAVSGNRFSGEVPAELGSCQSLEFLDLDRNFFSGNIPPSLSRLRGLRRLNLSSNRLSGVIPLELGLMPGLQELYLSRNDLAGGIPPGLEKMTSLVALDLSDNHLDGQVPLHGVFANATGFKMAGNSALCGGAPHLRLPPCRPADTTRRARLFLKICLPIVGIILCFAVVLAVLQWRRKRKSTTANTVAPTGLAAADNHYPRVTYAELAKATDGFAESNLVGAGKYGSVYKGILSLKKKKEKKKKKASAHEAVAVAVKVFDLRQVGAPKTFLSECEALRSVRHRNLISIITCCSSLDTEGNEFRALVFDLMPNYSLDRWLHPKLEEKKWRDGLSMLQRLNIAVDIADAMNYLHNGCKPPIIHCDLKPSNVLLGEDMTAYIGDFGLAKLLVDDNPGSHAAADAESTIAIRGTIGYVAPEYGTTGSVSTAGDAYSFGVTVLENFVGKAPTDDAGFGDGITTLPEFVAAAFPADIERIVDPALLLPVEELDESMSVVASSSSYTEESSSGASEARVTAHDCMVSALRVALSCCRRAPYERMGMKEAAAEMRLVRDAYLGANGLN